MSCRNRSSAAGWRHLPARFARDERGAFAMMLVVSAIVLIAAAGLAVDYANALNRQSKLQSAVDTAVLAAGSSLTAASTDEEVRDLVERFVNANFNAGGDKLDLAISINQETRGVTVTANIDHKLYLMPIVGINRLKLAATSEVGLGRPYIELVLALDNSGSMEGTRMTNLKTSAASLVRDVLALAYQSGDIKIGLVPFAGMVNVGPGNAGETWMDRSAIAPIHSENFNQASNRFSLYDAMKDVSWAGCVETRPAPYDVTAAVPDSATPATLFVPSFAPDEPDTPAASFPYNNYLTDNGGTCTALPNGAGAAERQKRVCKYANTTPDQSLYLGTRKGPNFMCDSRPLTPLTATAATISSAITEMQAYGGTNILEGLMWGWRVLAPGLPFAGARPYGDRNGNRKVLVLMTDGENQYIGWPNTNGSTYSSYGYSAAGRIGSTSNDTATLKQAMDARTKLACQNAKAAGIDIYTVAWHVSDEPTITMLRDCATRPTMAAVANSDTELANFFSAVGGELSRLHLTR